MSDTFYALKEKFLLFSDDQRIERLNQCMVIQLALDECVRLSKRNVEKIPTKRNQEDGSKDRLSKSSWSNKIWSKATQDELQEVKNNNDRDDRPKIKLEETRAGMKMSRFYEWGLVNTRAQAAIAKMREEGGTWNSLRPTDNNNSSSNSKSIKKDHSDDISSEKSTSLTESSSSAPGKSSSLPSCCGRETHALWGCRAIALGCAPDLVKLKSCFENKLGTTNPSLIQYEDSNSERLSSSPCGREQKVVGDCVLKNWAELNDRIKNRSK